MSAGTQTAPREHSSKGARDRGAQPSGSGARSVLRGGLACPCAWLPARFPWGDIRPALLGPSPRRAIPGLGAEGWGQGSRRGKKPQPLGKAGGPGDSLCCALVPPSGRAGGRRRKRVGLERARGYSSPGLSQTRADPSSPVPSQETGTYFISLGQVRPRYQPPPTTSPAP